jgi:hypothetical protein
LAELIFFHLLAPINSFHRNSTIKATKKNDFAGTKAGIELDKLFDLTRDPNAFAEGFCELIVDKGLVHYRE